MRSIDQYPASRAELVDEKSAEIHWDVGFCLPGSSTLGKLDGAGFVVDNESQMIRIPIEQLDSQAGYEKCLTAVPLIFRRVEHHLWCWGS